MYVYHFYQKMHTGLTQRPALNVLVWFSFNVQFNNFSDVSGQSHRFLGIYQSFGNLKVSCSRTLYGGRGVEPWTSRSGVRSSTTESPRPPRSQCISDKGTIKAIIIRKTMYIYNEKHKSFLNNIKTIQHIHLMRHVMRKPAFCICENKCADQLRG